MKFKHTFLFSTFIAGALLTSCNKDEIVPEPITTPTNTPAASTTPTFKGIDGVLWAVKTTSSMNGFEVHIGTGVAVFFDSIGATTFTNVGKVELNSNSLAMQTNNSYVFTPSTTSPTGLNFSSEAIWNVAGGGAHAAFNFDTKDIAFPSASAITSSSTVTKADGYTLTCGTVTGADSTLFLIGNISKTVVGNAKSCTFSASELTALDAGTSFVQIVPYAILDQTINGKKYYFGKEDVRQLAVTIK